MPHVLLVLLLTAVSAYAYEGYSPITTGGEGGAEVFVTSLTDSGTGSLRDVLSRLTGSPTIVKFSVGGAIHINSPLVLTKSYVTIAGETAPAPGISIVATNALRALELKKVHEVIVRHIRIRNPQNEGIQIWGDSGIVIDHVSITGAGDGALDINEGVHHLVVSRSLFGGNTEVHRAYGIDASFHHNFYAWNNRRQPKIFRAGPNFDFRNNYIDKWTGTGTNVNESTAGVNIIANHYGTPSPHGQASEGFMFTGGSTNVHTSGNFSTLETINTQGNRSTPVPEPDVATLPADEVPANILADVGAQPSDAIDQYYLSGGGTEPPAPPGPGGDGGQPQEQVPVGPDKCRIQVLRGTNNLEVGWTDLAENEDGFQLRRDTVKNFGSSNLMMTNVSANATKHLDVGLVKLTRYHYQVRAINSAGVSPWSSMCYATAR